jgi:hypothetical protein
MEDYYKMCSCGHIFITRTDYVKDTTECGMMYVSGKALELRNCKKCFSTLSVDVSMPGGMDDQN